MKDRLRDTGLNGKYPWGQGAVFENNLKHVFEKDPVLLEFLATHCAIYKPGIETHGAQAVL